MESSSTGEAIVRPGGALRAVVTGVGLYALAGGTLTLIGWAAGIQRLTDWRNDSISMFPNTAICAVLSGMALLLLHHARAEASKLAVRVMGAVVAMIGGLTLFQHIAGIDLGIDVLLFEMRPWGQHAAAAPMRMGPPASLSFLMIGSATYLLTGSHRARRVASALAVAVAPIATLSLIGYLYGAREMYTIPRLTGIAMQTASIVFALAIGVIVSAPDREPMRGIMDAGAAGTLARRAMPIIIVIAVLLGWIRVSLQTHGLVDTAFGTALRTVFEIAFLMTLLWWAVKMVRAHEDALHEREAELQLQSRRKDEFLAMLAHELRNPLAPLSNGLQTLALIGADTNALEQLRPMMQRQLSHMVRLVDDLLDASRISRDKLELRMERVELGTVVHEAVQACRPQLQAASLQLEVAVPDGDAIALDADPVRLVQVLCNLIGNAVKYTDAGGRIHVTLERDDATAARISIKDTGIGIPGDMLEHVFEMFTQVDRSLERMSGGLGIGLTLARRLVEMHGGTLSARSDGPGHGTELIVRLPVLAATGLVTPAYQRDVTRFDSRMPATAQS